MPTNRYRPASGAADTTTSLVEVDPVLGTRRGMQEAWDGATRVPAGGRLGLAQSVLWRVIQPEPAFAGSVNGPTNSLPACSRMVSPPAAAANADRRPAPSDTVSSAARRVAGTSVMPEVSRA